MTRTIGLTLVLVLGFWPSARAADFADRGLDPPAYAEILRGVEFVASSQVASDDNVDHLIHLLQFMSAGDFGRASLARVLQLGLADPAFVDELSRFISEHGGARKATTLLREQPQLFLTRPRIAALTSKLKGALIADASLILQAADRMDSTSEGKYLPVGLPVKGDPPPRDEARDRDTAYGSVDAAIAAAAAVCATVPNESPIVAAILQLVAQVVELLEAIVKHARDEAAVVKELVQEMDRGSSKPITATYLGAATLTVKRCNTLTDKAERTACLKAALLLIGNSY